MRDSVKAIKWGIHVLVAFGFAWCVWMQAMQNGTGQIGATPVDGTLAEHWSDVPSHTYVPRGCWTGDAPKGVIPGHVYGVFPGGAVEKRGPVWTGKALDSLFGKKPVMGLTVIAFCR